MNRPDEPEPADATTGNLESPRDADRYLRGLERLVVVVQELSLARTLDALMEIVRRAARDLTGADGATFVLRDGEFCHYAEELAIAPLWKGRRFPLDTCISGWAMRHRQPVVIEDVYADPRIPIEAYRPTFVKSLVMVPIRTLAPVGAIGNYWATSHRASPDEVRLLSALADSTSIAMENVNLYEMLEQRVQERTAALVRAQRQKEEMAALLVHDIKSPATGILMTCTARLRSRDVSDAERLRWKTVQAGAEVISRLALNILDVSRSDEGLLVPRVEPIDVRRLLESVAELMGPLAEGHDRALAIAADVQDGADLHADAELLRRTLQNLIDNAVRYSPKGSTVRLEALSTRDELEIRVIDEGPGIPPDQRTRIFDRYTRLEGGLTASDATGRGLGLAFCRLAVESHGGSISVEANVPHGSVFVLRLPLRRAAASA